MIVPYIIGDQHDGFHGSLDEHLSLAVSFRFWFTPDAGQTVIDDIEQHFFFSLILEPLHGEGFNHRKAFFCIEGIKLMSL